MPELTVKMLRGPVPDMDETEPEYTDTIYSQVLREDVTVDSVEVYWDGQYIGAVSLKKGPPPPQEALPGLGLSDTMHTVLTGEPRTIVDMRTERFQGEMED